MSQIITKVLKQGTTHSKIISCSFFTFKEAYKSFDRYIDNLNIFLFKLSIIKTIQNNFEIRVYTDNTGKDDALKAAEKYPDVSVIHFDCPEFRDGKGHIGFFGSLVRLLPLFEKHKLVWISDIDTHFRQLEDWDFKEDIGITNQLCYPNIRSRKYAIVLHKFLSKVEFPKQLLTRFLNKFLDGSLEEKVSELNKDNTQKPSSNFPYGMDELFITSTVYDWIKKKDFKICVYLDFFSFFLGEFIKNNNLKSEYDKIVYQNYLRKSTPAKDSLIPIKNILKIAYTEIVKKNPCAQQYVDILNDPKSFKTTIYPKIIINSSDL